MNSLSGVKYVRLMFEKPTFQQSLDGIHVKAFYPVFGLLQKYQRVIRDLQRSCRPFTSSLK